MNERNKQTRAIVRQMTSGQTPAEVEAQKSLTTANSDWITPDDKKSPRQQAHDSRRGVKQAREALAEACWKGYKAKGMKKKGSKTVPNCVKEGRMDLAERVLSELSIGALKRYRNKALAQDQAGGGSARRSSYIGRAEDKIRKASDQHSDAQKAATGEHGNVGSSKTATQSSTTAGGGAFGNKADQEKANANREVPKGRMTPERDKVFSAAVKRQNPEGKPTRKNTYAPNPSLDIEQAGKGSKNKRIARSNK